MYSQRDEEQHILEILDGVTGRFLDIGAWNPEVFSNTRALFECGWSGVVVEPSPGPVHILAQFYSGKPVEVIAGAVTVEGGPIRLMLTDDAVTAEAESGNAARWKESGGYYGIVTVQSIALRDFFARWGGDFEMVSIDTEGTSVDLFAEMITIGPRPRCVVVEHDNRFVELSGHAQRGGYRMVYENGENRVYEWTGKREK
jgi:FkbM family methyltransferase